MRDFFARNLPLDSDPGKEKGWLLWGAILGFVSNLSFLISYLQARDALFLHQGRRKVL